MSSVFPILLGAGGIALVASQKGTEGDLPERDPAQDYPVGIPPRSPLDSLRARHGTTYPGADGIESQVLTGHRMESHSSLPREVMDRAEKRMREYYEAQSNAAKEAVCKKLKSEFPANEQIQGLPCPSDWDDLTTAAITAAAVAGATAICGPVCGALAGPLAAAAGVKVTDWVAEGWDDLSSEAKEAWEDGKDWVEGVYEDVEDAISDAAGYLNPFQYL